MKVRIIVDRILYNKDDNVDKKIIKNYLYNVLVQIINIIIPFITIPYISRVLVPEELGLYNYTLNVMTYFSIIAELGFQFYGQKAIVECKSKEEEETTFLKILKLKYSFGFLVLAVYYLIVILFLKNKMVYCFQGFAILGVVFDITWYYAGKENFKKIAFRGLFLKLVSFVLLLILVRGDNALYKYVLSIQVTNFIGNILMYYGLSIKIHNVKIEIAEVKIIMFSSLSLLIPSILTSIYQIVDKAVLGEISTMTHVGYYSQMLKLVGLFSAIVFSIGKVVFPRLVHYYNIGNINNVQILVREIASFIFHIGIPICIGIYSILDIFVPWFYGNQYLVLIKFFPYALPLILIISLNNVFSSQLLIAINEEKKLYLLIIINVIVNVSLDFLLIKKWNSVGALIASIIAECVQFFGSILIYKKIIGGRIFQFDNIIAIISGIIMGITIIFLKSKIEMQDIFLTFLLVFIGVMIYLFCLYLLRDPLVIKGIGLLIKKIKKREG